MPTSTTNYGLIKPGTDDPILIGQLNDNMDTIDAALKENADAIENKPDAADIPTPSTAAPAMDGTAAAGTSTDYARADHVHPSDTSKASATSEAEDRAALVELVDGGAKNHINNTLTSGTTPSGKISYTVNSDSSITITGGTATANADIVIPFSVNKSGTYVLTGGAAGGSAVTYKGQITLYPSMLGVVEIFDDISAEITLTAGTDYAFRFRVYSGKTVPDCTIYPMVCTKAAWDISQTYQPYRPSYQELYEQTETDEATIAELVEANRRKVYANTENDTSYTFSNLYGLNESRFKYALVCGGGTANNPALAMAWLVFIDDSGVVTVRKIIGDSTRTLTGSVSGTTLTLTTDSTMYGGLRLIWLS